MCTVTIFLFATFLLFAAGAGADCETGWTIYKDELCIRAFPNLLTNEEAQEFCATQSEGGNPASLVMVKGEDLQHLLVNYTNDIFNVLWLGGQYDEGTGQYRWDDGDVFTYTNWQEGYPRNSSDTGCVELKPVNSKAESLDADAKWADANCQKRNQVMCQRAASWSLQDAIEEIKRIRDELRTTSEKLTEELEATNTELERTNAELRSGSNAFAVGSIYIEYYNQPNPLTLWPNWAWEDISSLYAGLFFRTTGGGSASWGEIQTECAPRINQTDGINTASPVTDPNPIPANGWSDYGASGYQPTAGPYHYDGIRFYTAGCEVRPRNQAVRVWKRVA